MSKRFRFYIVAFMIFIFPDLYGQEIKVSGGFLTDSIRIGEPFGYYLTAAYPQELTALFPDSTYAFTPFEFGTKKLFTTHTLNGISRDSVVYYLSTFEVDKIQILSLPVFITTARDCTSYAALPDSIYLIELVTKSPADSVQAQNLPLKTNTLYEKVFTQFNYIILILIVGVLLVVAIAGWIIFGKKVIQYFKIKELKKKYNAFLTDFTTQLNQLSETFSPERAEKTVLIWKRYMEGLSKIPYTRYTTTEIKAFASNEIGPSLASIDRMTYGRMKPDSLDAFQQLKSEAENLFKRKISQVEKDQETPSNVNGVEINKDRPENVKKIIKPKSLTLL